MTMNVKERLIEILLKESNLIEIEPNIYSILEGDISAPYDRWGGIYEKVACNRFYNRLIWGYWTSEFNQLCLDALKSGNGWVLDAGCGSLAFTARAYLAHTTRPVILTDRSLRMLQFAKRRIINLKGTVPENMIFLHADSMNLPIHEGSIQTVVAMNIIHAVEDAKRLVQGLEGLMASGGSAAFSTIIKNNRCADRYLRKLAEGGAMTGRDQAQLIALFSELGINGSYCTKGNMAFVNTGATLPYFANNQCLILGT